MDEPKYKRVLLKISGEALAGDKHFGLDFKVMGQNIGVTLCPPQNFLALNIAGNEHAGGQLGAVALLLID